MRTPILWACRKAKCCPVAAEKFLAAVFAVLVGLVQGISNGQVGSLEFGFLETMAFLAE